MRLPKCRPLVPGASVLMLAWGACSEPEPRLEPTFVPCADAPDVALAKASALPASLRRTPAFCVTGCDWGALVPAEPRPGAGFRVGDVLYAARETRLEPRPGDAVCADFFGVAREAPEDPRFVAWIQSVHPR